MDDVGGPSIPRGNWDLSFSGSVTAGPLGLKPGTFLTSWVFDEISSSAIGRSRPTLMDAWASVILTVRDPRRRMGRAELHVHS